MIPVNSTGDKSTTCIKMHVAVGTLVDTFYRSFRRWLKAHEIDIVQYSYQAQLEEFVCGNLPEQK
jgi:hypothetical protein